MAETQPLPEYGLQIDREGKHELVTLGTAASRAACRAGLKRLAIEKRA